MAEAIEARLEEIAARHAQVQAQMSTPQAATDPEQRRDLGKAFAELDEIVRPYRVYQEEMRQAAEARELASTEADTDMAAYLTAEAEQVPEWVRPLPDQYNGEDLTIGWLLEARDAGRLPVPGDMNPRNVATFPIRVGLAFVDEPPVEDGCRTQTAPLDLSLVEGDRLAIRTSVNVATVADGKPTSRPVRFDPRPSGALSVEVSALDVRFTPVVPGGAFTVCY